MTWTRLDDLWTERPELESLSFPDRWHYLAMIQLCSRKKQYDGIVRHVDASRCSDHPDPAGALQRIAEQNLIEVVAGGYQVLEIDNHIPPPYVRKKSEGDRVRKQRSRAHRGGDHSMCLPEFCEVTRDQNRDSRTGQDGTGQAITQPTLQAVSNDRITDWDTRKVAS